MLSTTLFPTESNIFQSTTFTNVSGHSSSISQRISSGIELNAAFIIAKKEINESAWFVELRVGFGFETMFLTRDVASFYYRWNGWAPTPPTISNFQSRTTQLTALVDNHIVFSKVLRKLEIGLGLNFRCRYSFFTHTKREGTTQEVGQDFTTAFSESGHDFWDLATRLDNFYASSFSVQSLLTVKPVVLNGFYATIRLPLHPVVEAFSYSEYSYGFSIGIGYQFSSK